MKSASTYHNKNWIVKDKIVSNIKTLNTAQEKAVAIRSVAGGGEIALRLGFDVDSLALSICDENKETDARPPKNDEETIYKCSFYLVERGYSNLTGQFTGYVNTKVV